MGELIGEGGSEAGLHLGLGSSRFSWWKTSVRRVWRAPGGLEREQLEVVPSVPPRVPWDNAGFAVEFFPQLEKAHLSL